MAKPPRSVWLGLLDESASRSRLEILDMNSQALRQTANPAMLTVAQQARVARQPQKQRARHFGGNGWPRQRHHRCYRAGRLVPGGVLTRDGPRHARYKEARLPTSTPNA